MISVHIRTKATRLLDSKTDPYPEIGGRSDVRIPGNLISWTIKFPSELKMDIFIFQSITIIKPLLFTVTKGNNGDRPFVTTLERSSHHISNVSASFNELLRTKATRGCWIRRLTQILEVVVATCEALVISFPRRSISPWS